MLQFLCGLIKWNEKARYANKLHDSCMFVYFMFACLWDLCSYCPVLACPVLLSSGNWKIRSILEVPYEIGVPLCRLELSGTIRKRIHKRYEKARYAGSCHISVCVCRHRKPKYKLLCSYFPVLACPVFLSFGNWIIGFSIRGAV